MSGMPLCRDCRWWDPEDSVILELTRSPESANELALVGMGVCTLTESKDNVPMYPTHIFAQSCDGCRVVAVTAPDFGCVQWEAKT